MPNPIRRYAVRFLAVAAMALSFATLFVSAQNAVAQRPPVTWVNPELPKGDGLSHHVLDSEALGHEVGYVVWTPPKFDASGKTKYPVIYFLHGMGRNASGVSVGFSGLIRRGIRRGIRDGVVPPAICVFPNGGRSGYRGKVETMIVDELIPQIDKYDPTKTEAKGRAVAGFSMGGAGAAGAGWVSCTGHRSANTKNPTGKSEFTPFFHFSRNRSGCRGESLVGLCLLAQS